MTRPSRRSFCRALAALGCTGLGACKVEPILGIDDEDTQLPLSFPDPPPQIPDQLADAETTLRALTQELLERELPLMTEGRLRSRPSEDPQTSAHLVALMESFGLVPAGTRGGWRQTVQLEIVEPSEIGTAQVLLRPESEAPLARVATEPEPAATLESPETPETPETPADAPPSAPPEAKPPTEDAPPEAPPEPDPAPEPEAPPSRGLTLAARGAFRQRSAASSHQGLLVGPVLDWATPLSNDVVAGRIAVFRAPEQLRLDAPDAPALVDTIMSAVRDAGALGCLLLSEDEGPGVERFRTLWRRQVRRGGASELAMLIEGLLDGEGRQLVEQALGATPTPKPKSKPKDRSEGKAREPWVLDLDLATRSYEVQSHNVLGRITGRERPDEAIVLTASWDTPDPLTAETDSLRLVATLAAFSQLAEWSRRSTPPRESLVLLLSVDAGFAAGQTVHAAWSTDYGAETKALLALDRPTREPLPAVSLSGHYDAGSAELARRVVASDGRDLLLLDQLAMPSLAPYLRYPAPVMTIGAPDPEAIEDAQERAPADPNEGDEGDEGDGSERGEDGTPTGDSGSPEDPYASLYADVRLLRNLVLALAERRW